MGVCCGGAGKPPEELRYGGMRTTEGADRREADRCGALHHVLWNGRGGAATAGIERKIDGRALGDRLRLGHKRRLTHKLCRVRWRGRLVRVGLSGRRHIRRARRRWATYRAADSGRHVGGGVGGERGREGWLLLRLGA